MSRRLALALVPALAFLLLTVFDIWYETENPSLADIAIEVGEKLLLVGSMVAIALTTLRIERVDARAGALRDRLDRALVEGRAWRGARAAEIAALGDAIQAEFRDWGLTPAEGDVAGLILKGASMKEIALARDTSEATIRQQSQQIYRKSGLSGRAELQAYFLDSLFGAAEDHRTGLRAVT